MEVIHPPWQKSGGRSVCVPGIHTPLPPTLPSRWERRSGKPFPNPRACHEGRRGGVCACRAQTPPMYKNLPLRQCAGPQAVHLIHGGIPWKRHTRKDTVFWIVVVRALRFKTMLEYFMQCAKPFHDIKFYCMLPWVHSERRKYNIIVILL